MPTRPRIDPNDLFQRAAVEEIWYDPIAPLPKAEQPPAKLVRETKAPRFDYYPEPVVLYSQPANTWSYNVVVQDHQGISGTQTVVQPAIESKPAVAKEEPLLKLPRQHRRRFTWESPEMYVDESNDELG